MRPGWLFQWQKVFLMMLLPVLMIANRGFAQSGIAFENVAAIPEFGKSITFQATIRSEVPVEGVVLVIQSDKAPPETFPMSLSETGEAVYRLETSPQKIRPFTRLEYQLRVRLQSGTEILSPTYSVLYEDTRFPWEITSRDLISVYWYERESDFGTTALSIAEEGLRSAQRLIPVTLQSPITIYVYNSSQDIRDVLQSSNPWIAGHAAPEHNLVLVSIAPGLEERLEMERQMPHEIMHILQYQYLGEKITQQPIWLIEGLASVAELYPNPDYLQALEQSALENRLIPINSLCQSFPRDASGAFLAYAESDSFVRYLYRNFGATGLQNLMEQYNNGLECEKGFEKAFAYTLTQMETRWKQEELRVSPEALIFRNLSPYLIVFLVLFGATAASVILVKTRG
ncbi:MAG: peptidase MA family metallohydrolase [Anaerolinea sp.]